MTDIVERLYEMADDTTHELAAEEITRLRGEIVLLEATGAQASDEIERLRAALRLIVKQSCETFHINPEGGANITVENQDRFAFEKDVSALLSIARAALAKEPGNE